jgi:hypothetical protein
MPSLHIGGLTLKVMELPMGLRLSTEDPDLRTLTWVINRALDGAIPDLGNALRRGDDVYYHNVYVYRPRPGQDLSEGVAVWVRHTRRDPGADVYVLRSALTETELVVPRTVFVAIWEALAPPDLEVRSANRSVQYHLGEQLHTTQERLFTSGSTLNEPIIGEEAVVKELSARAAELDVLTQRERTAENHAEEAAKRRFLLLDLDAAGLFEPWKADIKRNWLHAWGLRNLVDYQDAAFLLRQYLASPERLQVLPPIARVDTPNAPISLDWWRTESPIIEGRSPHRWLAHLETVLRDTSVGCVGGTLPFRTQEGTYDLVWRCDDGVHRCIVTCKLG